MDLLAVICLGLAGEILRGVRAEAMGRLWRRKGAVLVAIVLVHASLIGSLACQYSNKRREWLFLPLLLLSTLNLLRLRRRTRPTTWIILGSIVLFSLFIDGWWFTLVGDEYVFWDYAEATTHQTFRQIGSHLFSVEGGQEGYSYLATLIQAASMKVAGVSTFGWRFSSLYLSALAIGFFYRFFRTFADRGIAVLASLFLGSSHYVMTFGKIGYPILQAYFAMSLVLSAAGWAVRTRRPVAFTCLGLATGLCFYVYPAALYVVPLPFFLLLLYVPPTSRAALSGWVTTIRWSLTAIFPLLFEFGFWRTKVPGTIFYNPSIIQSSSQVLSHFLSNLVYAAFSHLYVPQETHFVAVSYVDPATGALFAIGLILVLRRLPARFAVFLIAGYAELLFFVGSSHDRAYPPTTRMFLLLPWFALTAAIGASWVLEQLGKGRPLRTRSTSTVLLATTVVALNLYQAYPLSRRRMTSYQAFAALFNRVAQRAGQLVPVPPKTFVVVTDGSWREGPSGYHRLQRIYSLPPSPEQFVVLKLEDGRLPEGARALLSDRNTLAFFRPEMSDAAREPIERLLSEFGKVPCPVRTTLGEIRFNLWQSPELPRLCD